jgi:HK97 family phage major capsid protein
MFDKLTPEAEAILSDITAYHRANLRAAMRKRNAPTLNLTRMFTDLSRGHVHGEDREALQEYARRDGVEYSDPQKPYIPFSELYIPSSDRRDLNKAVVGAGGYLASAETTDPVDILRPFSVPTKMGVTVEVGLVGDQVIPKVSAKSTPYWLSTETAAVTASQPTLQQVTCTAKQVGIAINFSRHLSKQANAEYFVRRESMRTVGTAIGQALINGTGAAGQPTGLLNTSGVQTQSGTTLNAGVHTMKKLSSEANVDLRRASSAPGSL